MSIFVLYFYYFMYIFTVLLFCQSFLLQYYCNKWAFFYAELNITKQKGGCILYLKTINAAKTL